MDVNKIRGIQMLKNTRQFMKNMEIFTLGEHLFE